MYYPLFAEIKIANLFKYILKCEMVRDKRLSNFKKWLLQQAIAFNKISHDKLSKHCLYVTCQDTYKDRYL